MAIGTGVNKQVIFKPEVTWGTLPAAGSAQVLRRVSANFQLKKDTYVSNELRSDFQDAVFTHGPRKVEGTVSGEVSPGTYSPFLAAAVRKTFTAVTAVTGLTITIASSGNFWTLTRSAGSWISDNIRFGMVGRLTAGAFNVANSNTNLAIVSLTATVLTVAVANGAALVAEGPIATATFTVTGKVTYAPLTGHTDPSFAFEEWHNDIAQSERFVGCKLNTVDIKLPATGMATIDMAFIGKDMTTATAQYFTSPTGGSTTGTVAAINGVLIVNGVKLVTLTGLNLKIMGNQTSESVIGSNTVPDIFEGRIQAEGDFTAFFEDGTLRDIFVNETQVALLVMVSVANSATADFVSFYMPIIKVNDAAKDDGDKGIKRTYPFKALLNSTTGTGIETTSLQIQDSLA